MEYAIFTGAVILFFIFILFRGIRLNRREKEKFRKALTENYGVCPERKYKPEEFEACRKYYLKHRGEGQIDDITWNDLDMDGLYKKINCTFSSAGDEYLYYTLRTPSSDQSELEERERLIQYFTEHEKERIRFQEIFHKLGRTGKYSVYDYLGNLEELGERKNLKHWIADFLFLPAIALCCVRPLPGLLLIAVLVIRNVTVYFREKAEIEPYIVSFSYVLRLLEAAESLAEADVEECRKETEELREAGKKFVRFKRGSFWLMSPARMNGSMNPLDILTDYLRMIFHPDLIQFNRMLDEVRIHAEDADSLIRLIGSLETAVAVGSYRKSLKNGYCIPQFSDTSGTLVIRQCYHPLLSDPVKNSVQTEKGILLTGSNASGKSTFLRTVAINAVFAQTIHTCTAEEYTGSFFRVFTSMSLKDSLYRGESYYIVEIKSIKRILDETGKSDIPVLCFVDEVLRGTNTVERIAAATQILKCLSSERVLCFAATHDLELTRLLSGQYENYHFEEEIQDGDIHFSYRLLPGAATTRNAIRLLKEMGYDTRMTGDAEWMAGHFLNTGEWKKRPENGED